MRWILLIVATIVIAGCKAKQSELELKASELKAGMTKSEIKILFANFAILDETNRIYKMETPSTSYELYVTNKLAASAISFANYRKNRIFAGECCVIYFDTNDVIVARQFIRFD